MALRDANRIPGSVQDLTAIAALSDVADKVLFVSDRTLALLANLAEVDVKIYSRYAKSYLAGGMVDVVDDDDSEADDVDEIANNFGVEVVPVTTVRDVISATMYKTAAGQTLTNGVTTKIVWGAVDEDLAGMCDLTNEQVVIPRAGRWIITGRVLWDASAVGTRVLWIKKNSIYIGRTDLTPPPTFLCGHEITVSGLFSVGDVITLEAYQNSGGNLQINYTATGLYWNMLGVVGF